MAARLEQVLGTEPALPFDIMNRIIGPNGLLNSTKLAAEMARSSPEAIFEAINQAFWCGGNVATMAESLRSWVRKWAIDPDASPPNHPNPNRAQAASVNLARLAFQQAIDPILDKILNPGAASAGQFAPKPIVFGDPQLARAGAGAVTMFDTQLEKAQEKFTILPRDSRLAEQLPQITHHELVHAHAHLDYERWIAADIKNRGQLNEALTECLSTYMWSRNASDSRYETMYNTDGVCRKLLACATESETSPEGSFELGLQVLQHAYLAGNPIMLNKLTQALNACQLPWGSTLPELSPLAQVVLGVGSVTLVAGIGAAVMRYMDNDPPDREVDRHSRFGEPVERPASPIRESSSSSSSWHSARSVYGAVGADEASSQPSSAGDAHHPAPPDPPADPPAPTAAQAEIMDVAVDPPRRSISQVMDSLNRP